MAPKPKSGSDKTSNLINNTSPVNNQSGNADTVDLRSSPPSSQSDSDSNSATGRDLLISSGRWGDSPAAIEYSEYQTRPLENTTNYPAAVPATRKTQNPPHENQESETDGTTEFGTNKEATTGNNGDIGTDMIADDRYEACVLWIKKTFRVPEDEIRENTIKAFREKGVNDVEIVALYVTTSKTKDHGYMVLNSSKASKLLLNGTINVSVNYNNDDDAQDSVFLWFDKADHLVPKSNQDPYTLYIWQLPTDRPAKQVEEELFRLISPLSPIISMEVPDNATVASQSSRYRNNDNGDRQTEGNLCAGWAKVYFSYEFDTQKCVYMLNFNRFLGVEIRAGFCNTDRHVAAKPQSSEEKTRSSNPRPKGSIPKQGSGKKPKGNRQKKSAERFEKVVDADGFQEVRAPRQQKPSFTTSNINDKSFNGGFQGAKNSRQMKSSSPPIRNNGHQTFDDRNSIDESPKGKNSRTPSPPIDTDSDRLSDNKAAKPTPQKSTQTKFASAKPAPPKTAASSEWGLIDRERGRKK